MRRYRFHAFPLCIGYQVGSVATAARKKNVFNRIWLCACVRMHGGPSSGCRRGLHAWKRAHS